ncbi:MAG TPA: class I SAM-dependent methyltransferase [Roseiarcus sp.]
MNIASKPTKNGDKGVVMEGRLADWYAKNTGAALAGFENDARRVAARLRSGARVLEIAPGPGYLAIALAKLGDFDIVGLDISRSFVRIARQNAAEVSVAVEFTHGDASEMAFPTDSFDFIVCRAAFKNFADPLGALCEMHRVLRPGGEALIIHMNKNASNAAIDHEVDGMRLGLINSFITRTILKTMLRKRAYAKTDFQRMAAATPFGGAEVGEASMGLDVWLRK